MGMDIFNVLNGSTSDNALIPGRDPGAVSGSGFAYDNMSLTGSVREQNILNEFLAGNIPDFLRKFIGITISVGADTISYLVMPDFLSIGSDEDYLRMPLTPISAQVIANKFDCTLPTTKMVNDIWKASTFKLAPKPFGPPYDATMMSTDRFVWSNNAINQQIKDKNIPLGSFIDGFKKNIVLTNRLNPNNPNKRVAIYGWMLSNGQPIQGLNPVSHEWTYSDYSHGVRLISNDVFVNGNLMRIQDVFSDAKLASLVSNEGALTFLHY